MNCCLWILRTDSEKDRKFSFKELGEHLISQDAALLRDLCVILFTARHKDDVSLLWFISFSKYALFVARTRFVTLFLCFLQSSNFFSCLNLSRVFIALIISMDNHWGSVGCLTLFLRSGACFSMTGRKASYQADNALVGSETLNTAANGAELRS